MWFFFVIAGLMICAGCLAAAVIVGEEKRARNPRRLRPRQYRTPGR